MSRFSPNVFFCWKFLFHSAAGATSGVQNYASPFVCLKDTCFPYTCDYLSMLELESLKLVEINKTKTKRRHVRKFAKGKVSQRRGRDLGDLDPMKCAATGWRGLWKRWRRKRGWLRERFVCGERHTGRRGGGAKGMGADVRAEKGEGTSPWI